MSDANRTQIALVEETEFGVIPLTPIWEILRFTSSSLAFNPQTVTSEELRADRQVPDLILVGAEAGGDIGFELSMQSFDRPLEGTFFNRWSTAGSKLVKTDVTDIGVTTPNMVKTVADPTGDFAVGDIVTISGSAFPENNKTAPVTAVAAGGITFADPFTPDDLTAVTSLSVYVTGKSGVAADISATSTGITSASSALAGLNAVPGMWLKMSGWTTLPGNNGVARVKTVSAGSIVFDVFPEGWAVGAEAGTVAFGTGRYLRNGVLELSYTIQTMFFSNDMMQYLRGEEVGTFSLNLDPQAIATGSFTFMGRDGQYVEGSFTGNLEFQGPTDTVAMTNGVPDGSTWVSPPATPVLNTSSNVGVIMEGGQPVKGPNFVQNAQITIENNLRMQNAVANLGAIGIGVGTCAITGTLSTYFGNIDLLKKVLKNTDTSFLFVVGRSDGGQMLWDFPRTKYSSGNTPVTGINTDIIAELGFQAIRHPTLGYQCQLQAFD